jgi:DNA gyrase subunit A
MLSLKGFEDDRYLFFATRKGVVKRTRLDAFDSPRSVLIALNLKEGDELVGVAVTDGTQDIMLVSRGGQAIRFAEDDARPMGRTAAGVTGMRFKHPDDEVLAMAPIPAESAELSELSYLLVVTERGYGKRTPIDDPEHKEGYPRHRRGGQGVKTISDTETRGALAGALLGPLVAEILRVTDSGTLIRMALVDVRPMGRSTQGVSLMRPGDGARVVGVAMLVDEADEALEATEATEATE